MLGVNLGQVAGNGLQQIGSGDDALKRSELINDDSGVNWRLSEKIERSNSGCRFVHDQRRPRLLFHVWRPSIQKMVGQVLLAHNSD
nr:hypothetical protein [Bradyrhizobium erythrophlei]